MSMSGTEQSNDESITAISWEKIGSTSIPFIRKANGQLFTSKHLLTDALFKQEFPVLKNEIFELTCSPALNKYRATKLEIRLLNEMSKEMLNISLTDRPNFFIKIEDVVEVYKVLKNFHTIILERKLTNPLFGFVFIEDSQTPVPFLSVRNVGLVVPTFFFECQSLEPLTFSLLNHWDWIYFKLLFKLLGIRKTFYNNPKVVRLKNLTTNLPEIKTYTVATYLPKIAQVSEFTVQDDDIILVENIPEPIEISSSDDESGDPQAPKKARIKFTEKTDTKPDPDDLTDEQVKAGASNDTIMKDNQQSTRPAKSFVVYSAPQSANSTNQQQLVHQDPVEILDIPVPLNNDILDQEYLKLRENANISLDMEFQKVYKIIEKQEQVNYDVGVQRFRDTKYDFFCISTMPNSAKKVYLINLSEILQVLFPKVELQLFMFYCSKFSLKIFSLDTSHIKFLKSYYVSKNRDSPNDFFYLELRKFCDVYYTLKRLVEGR